MKLKRGTCIVGIVFSYVFLVLLYITLVKDANMRYPCTKDEPCVRFCCNNASLCKDDFIKAQFEANFTVQYDGDNENRSKDYIILRGTPTCEMKSVGKDIQEIGILGGVNLGKEFYDWNEYCFEKSNDCNQISWELKVCERNRWAQEAFNYSTLLLSLLFLAFTAYKYTTENRFKNVSGRIFLMFVISILSSYSAWLFIFPDDVAMSFFPKSVFVSGFIVAYLLLSVLVFDIWRTFRNFDKKLDDSKLMRNYCLYVGGISLAFVVLYFLTTFELIPLHAFRVLMMSFAFTAFLMVVFLALTGNAIYKLSKVTENIEDGRIEDERNRFWSYVLLLVMFAFTVFCECIILINFTHAQFVLLMQTVFAAALYTIFVYSYRAGKDDDIQLDAKITSKTEFA